MIAFREETMYIFVCGNSGPIEDSFSLFSISLSLNRSDVKMAL